ncbi:tetratricopeptide repeat protein [Sagittula sp. S175]|uniref:tetratricopeptide repeat protein n=1 Tax=Sagittula sp. S175 TaxID=3415129 RepID=UPI003C7A8C65
MLRAILLFTLLPVAALAVGAGDSKPPSKPKCEMGKVWDPSTQKCLNAYRPELDDAMRYVAVREYAYDGQFDAALIVLDAMQDQRTDGVLTYRGFIARGQGDMARAKTWYDAALVANPDNLLARSYMGQGLVVQGDLVGALAQHREIMARGGEGTWAADALADAIRTGTPYAY